MIKVISDTNRFANPVCGEILDSIENYPAIYAKCLSAFNSQTDFVVYVRYSVACTWLKNLSLRYPQGTFIFETLDARQALAQCIGMEIPTRVTNGDFFKTRRFATTDIVESSLNERNINGLFPVCG